LFNKIPITFWDNFGWESYGTHDVNGELVIFTLDQNFNGESVHYDTKLLQYDHIYTDLKIGINYQFLKIINVIFFSGINFSQTYNRRKLFNDWYQDTMMIKDNEFILTGKFGGGIEVEPFPGFYLRAGFSIHLESVFDDINEYYNDLYINVFASSGISYSFRDMFNIDLAKNADGIFLGLSYKY
jgi:hypothetical protein